MNELKHWLEEGSDANDLERAVLRAGLAADPPPGAEDEVWSNMLSALALAPTAVAANAVSAAGVKTAVTGASKAMAVWLGVGKGFVVGLAIYGAAAGASDVVSHFRAPAPRAIAAPKLAARAATLAPKREPAALNPLPEQPLPRLAPVPLASSTSSVRTGPSSPIPLPIPAALPSVAPFPEPENQARPSQLQAEAAALRTARAELRSGKLADAFATLEASRQRFSAPALYQEREALMIELLFRADQHATAQQRAAAFLQHFPDSPHATAIRQLSGLP